MSDRVLGVALDPQDGARSGLHQTILASLPARFRLVAEANGQAADVVLVSGDRPGWRQRAMDAIASQASAIVLSGFGAMTAEAVTQVAAAAAEAGVVAVADTAYASARTWSDAAPALARGLPGSAVLDSIITAPLPAAGVPEATALRTLLVEQLALLRPLLGEPGTLDVVHAAAREYVLAGPQRELAVTLSGTLSGSGGQQLDLALVGAQRRWHAQFAVDALAAPVTISVWDADGERTWPRVYESGHRTGWLRLHGAVGQGTRPHSEAGLYTASQLAADLTAAQAALS
jgi:hypothetical protein